MRTTIGDHIHPRGDINQAVFNLVRKVYSRVQKFEPWLDGATALTDIALVAPQPTFRVTEADAHQRSMEIVKGATRMLCELKMQFNVVSHSRDWSGYRLLILPDIVFLDDNAAKKVKAHLDTGGRVLASAWSGLDPDRKEFVLGEEWGVTFKGDDSYDPAYLLPYPQVADGLPNMPMNFYSHGAAVDTLPGTEVLGEIIAPYYNRYWDGEHGFLYLPPDIRTGQPAVTRRGQVGYITHAIFGGYFQHAPIHTRQLVANLSRLLLPNPLTCVQGLPSFGRVTVTSQKNRRMVHLLSYVPERRGTNIDMIEEPIEVGDVQVSLLIDGRTPKKVYLAPEHKALPFTIDNKYVHTTVPSIHGYAMVVFEEA